MVRSRWCPPLLALVLCAVSGSAQQASAPLRIAGITVGRQNVFDTSESQHWTTRFINSLHKRTLESVIRRELLFQVGDPFDTTRLVETERNLRRLGVFRDVQLDTVRTDSGMVVHIVTRDGWSWHPDFRFHSTGGSIVYTVAMVEDNLFGTATQAEMLYRKDPDRDAMLLSFRQPRLIAGNVGASLMYSDRSDGELFTGVVSQPFFSLSSRSAASIEFDDNQERILQFRDGALAASDTLQRRYLLGRLSVARALSTEAEGYLRAGLVAQVRRDDYVSQAVFDVTGGKFGHQVSGAFGGVLEQRRGDWLKVRAYQSFGRLEDVDLSRIIRGSIMLAPKVLGYAENGIAPALFFQNGVRLPSGFLLTQAWATGLFTRTGLDSGQVHLAVTAALLPSPRHSLVMHIEAGMLQRPLPGAEFDLGLGVGPRAFRQHAFTGDRQYFATAEYRYIVAPDVFKVVGVGIAAFADQGGATWQGQPMRSGTDVGIGVRLGPSRATDQEATRIDVARRFANNREAGGWVVVVGKGFVFGP